MIGRSSFLAKSVARNISTNGFRRLASTKSLRETLQEVIPAKQEQLKKLVGHVSSKLYNSLTLVYPVIESRAQSSCSGGSQGRSEHRLTTIKLIDVSHR
ncbi:hypothetical protein BDR03DRAFT_677016 [Suillus americanus]|nr:hypothetical protein BDR03DRAFT_677016 [Suillus americanus]